MCSAGEVSGVVPLSTEELLIQKPKSSEVTEVFHREKARLSSPEVYQHVQYQNCDVKLNMRIQSHINNDFTSFNPRGVLCLGETKLDKAGRTNSAIFPKNDVAAAAAACARTD